MRKSFNYYYTIEEYLTLPNKHLKVLNIIGKVDQIISADKNNIHFTIKQREYELYIIYKGNTPRMFSIGQEVVATGKSNLQKKFIANKILVKHDEVYSPIKPKEHQNQNQNLKTLH